MCICIYDVPDAASKRDVFKTGNMNGAGGLLVTFRDVHQFETTTPLPRATKRLEQPQKDAARLVAQIMGEVSDHGCVIVPARKSKRLYVESWGMPHVIAQVAREI